MATWPIVGGLSSSAPVDPPSLSLCVSILWLAGALEIYFEVRVPFSFCFSPSPRFPHLLPHKSLDAPVHHIVAWWRYHALHTLLSTASSPLLAHSPRWYATTTPSLAYSRRTHKHPLIPTLTHPFAPHNLLTGPLPPRPSPARSLPSRLLMPLFTASSAASSFVQRLSRRRFL